jgi:NADH:ubiquinone oxidoreductase subunit 5 (subunit L)/multisubunit Na+/H+ antiporter MnhA subunit
MSAFYSKELIIESLVIYNFSFYPYFIIVLGILITILYRIRFFKNIFQFKRNKRLLFITDYNFIIRVRILLLFIPAISGGRIITYIIDFSLIYFLIPKGIKRLIFLLILRRIII